MMTYKGETSLETRKQAEELLAELRRQAYAEGYEQAKRDAEKDAEIDKVWGDITNPPKPLAESPQQKRDRIIEQTKADLADLEIRMISDIANNEGSNIFRHELTEVDFVVNKEKRTVVALVEGRYMREIVAKGIAKCAPGDCFNVHIGKAIALRRALGLEVPCEYLNAPQPTEVRVGDVVEYEGYRVNVMPNDGDYHYKRKGTCAVGSIVAEYGKIIDDSESVAP